MMPGSNDNTSAFEDFMLGYWHQMSPDLYSSLSEALVDYKAMEGRKRHTYLLDDIIQLVAEDRFPSVENLESAYNDPFWARFGRILTIDEVMPIIRKLHQ